MEGLMLQYKFRCIIAFGLLNAIYNAVTRYYLVDYVIDYVTT